MQVNSVEDFDSFPAGVAETTTTPAAVPSTAPAEPAAAPKPSTIQIQSPPAKEQKKEDKITLALRQAGQEAATKAKENTQAKSAPTKVGSTSSPAESTLSASTFAEQISPAEQAKDNEKLPASSGEPTARRKSVTPAAEVSSGNAGRPSVVPEVAAVSSANFRAENAETLGLVEHHRGSLVSATSEEERDQVARDLRKSIDAGSEEGIGALRDEKAETWTQEETIQDESEEEPGKDAKGVEESEKINKAGEDATQKQDPKAAQKASTSVED